MENTRRKRGAKRAVVLLGSLAAGLVNGLLGSGGGMIAVPLLERGGVEPNRAHATSVAMMLPLSAVSAAFYLWDGKVTFADALPYIPGGIVGSIIGVFLLRKVRPELLRRIFGGVAVYSGLRILLK